MGLNKGLMLRNLITSLLCLLIFTQVSVYAEKEKQKHTIESLSRDMESTDTKTRLRVQHIILFGKYPFEKELRSRRHLPRCG